MVIAFPPGILQRLAHIEALEGMPPVELIHQAVTVWALLDRDERQRLGQVALGIVAERMRKGGHQ